LSTKLSPLVCSEPAASSETVNPLTFKVTAPEVPPPVSPVPAPTLSISPASLVKLITPVEESYAISPLALIAALALAVV